MLAVIGTLAGVILGLAGAWLVERWRERHNRDRERRDRRIAALYALQEHIPPITRNLLIQWEGTATTRRRAGRTRQR